jgi:hypothetical protein
MWRKRLIEYFYIQLSFDLKKVKHFFLHFFILMFLCVEEIFLITEMGVSNEAKNVIPLKFSRKIKNKNFFLL